MAFFSIVLIIWQSEQEEGTVEKGPRSKRDATAKKMIGRCTKDRVHGPVAQGTVGSVLELSNYCN